MMTPEQLIHGIQHLVSLPEAVARANELFEDPNSSLGDIAEVIGHDPSLSARLLRLVNSAFYGLPGQIDTLSRAISMIGTDELQSLIIAAGTADSFNRLAPDELDMNAFWNRSVYCALVAKTITTRTNRGKGEPQFLAGLLHDCGRLVLLSRQPELALELQTRHANEGRPLHQLECELMGFTSADIGATLLQSWHLPARISEAVRCQHTPDACRDFAETAWTLALALAITDQNEPDSTATPPTQALMTEAMERFNLDQEQTEQIAMDANLACLDVLDIISPNATLLY